MFYKYIHQRNQSKFPKWCRLSTLVRSETRKNFAITKDSIIMKFIEKYRDVLYPQNFYKFKVKSILTWTLFTFILH